MLTKQALPYEKLRCLATAALLVLAFWLVFSPAGLGAVETATASSSSSTRSSFLLNVHVVPHTHDDVGWLKTPDQYYTGANSSIQQAGVRFILDSVVTELLGDANKRFTYVEIAFFSRWFNEQTDKRKKDVASLVHSGRLSFANGGWCMHDEAVAHFSDMIDQTARGHLWLVETFGESALPKVGWQIDPFGHSLQQANLVGAAVGFEATFLGRADYGDLDRRRESKALEFRWVPESAGASPKTGAFVGAILGSGNYGPPNGFRWDTLADDPIDDDPTSPGYNSPRVVDAFVAASFEWSQRFAGASAGGDIMFTMGEDFNYMNAHLWFSQLDKLIQLVNADGRMNAFYSTPAAYIRAKKSTRWGAPPDAVDPDPAAALELVEDDFFPYSDAPHAVWSGYFSSRGGLKSFIRSSSGFLAASRQLAVASMLASSASSPHLSVLASAALRPLEDAVATAQHHDAVSGTSQQHVACEYARLLSRGRASAAATVSAALSPEAAPASTLLQQPLAASASRRALLADAAPALSAPFAATPRATPLLVECPFLNVSICAHTSSLLAPGHTARLVIYNPLGWEYTAVIRLPVPAVARLTLRDESTGAPVASAQLAPPSVDALLLRALHFHNLGVEPPSEEINARELTFTLPLPATGAVALLLTSLPGGADSDIAGDVVADATPLPVAPAAPLSASPHDGPPNGFALSFDGDGRTLSLRSGSTSASLRLSFASYFEAGRDAPDGGQSGGAYIHRPLGNASVDDAVLESMLSGPAGVEARMVASPWATLTLRLLRHAPVFEISWRVGPIPMEGDPPVGRTVALRVTTDIDSGSLLYTDANGRGLLRRVRDTRSTWALNATAEPVALNVYPIASCAALSDGDSTALSLCSDRSAGVSSLVDGMMEVHVARRLAADDGRGVGEALDEKHCGCCAHDSPPAALTGTLRVSLRPHARLAGAAVPTQMALDRALLILFGPAAPAGATPPLPPPLLASPLPPSVHLLTLLQLPPSSALLRLTHVFDPVPGPGSDAALSSPAIVDLATLFAGAGGANATALRRLRSASETRLSFAVRRPEDTFPSDADACGGAPSAAGAPCRGGRVVPVVDGGVLASYPVTLGPGETRAFQLDFA